MVSAEKLMTWIGLSLLLSLNSLVITRVQSVKNVKDLIPPPPQIERYSLGLKYQLADLFWIRAIQDFDYCEQQIAKRTCRGQSWLFQILDSATRLDEKYYPIYAFGGLALTIIISDYAGASIIFDRGVQNYPDRWQLLYRAAYHALYEERNFDKAADLYARSAQHGGPDWLPQLVSRMRDPSKRLELAKRMLKDMEQRQEDPMFIEAMQEKVAELEALEAPQKVDQKPEN